MNTLLTELTAFVTAVNGAFENFETAASKTPSSDNFSLANDKLSIKLGLPGYAKTDIEVSVLSGKTLRITDKASKALIKSFNIAPGFELSKMKVTMVNGLLSIVIPKKETQSEIQTITIE